MQRKMVVIDRWSLNPFACTLSMWKKCTFDKFLFTGRNFFVMQNCKKQPIYILKECSTHFPTRPSSSFLKNEMLTKLWFKVWSSVAHSFVDPEKRFRNLFHSEQLEKLNSLSGLQYHGKWASSFLCGIDSRCSDSPRFTTSQVSG